jgi:hypothetical protein
MIRVLLASHNESIAHLLAHELDLHDATLFVHIIENAIISEP